MTSALAGVSEAIEGTGQSARSSPPSERIDLTGFSVLPPQGEDWRMTKQTTQQVDFTRDTDSATHTVMAVAVYQELPRCFDSKEQFMEWVRYWYSAAAPSGRIRKASSEVVSADRLDATCARAREVSEDPEATNKGSAPFLLLENIVLICIHPTKTDRVVNLSVSQRSLPDEVGDDLYPEAIRFFAGLEIVN